MDNIDSSVDIEFEAEKLFITAVNRINSVLENLKDNQPYTIEEILTVSKLPLVEGWKDFLHIIIHCSKKINISYTLVCKKCNHTFNIGEVLPPQKPKICSLCHSHNTLVIDEIILKPKTVSKVLTLVPCSFCGKETLKSFTGVDNKIVCFDCLSNMKKLVKK